MIQEFIEEAKYDDSYGFLKSDGEFIIIGWGNHQEFARKEVDTNGWYKEFLSSGRHDEEDFLVYEKGWVLMDSPSQGLAQPSTGDKPLTKAQKEFLFDYYTKRNQIDLANEYLIGDKNDNEK